MYLIQVMPAAEELRTPVEGDRLPPAPEVAEVHREAPVPAEAVSAAAAAALRDQLQAVSGIDSTTYSIFLSLSRQKSLRKTPILPPPISGFARVGTIFTPQMTSQPK